jgi:carboxyl-terminal processing protease
MTFGPPTKLTIAALLALCLSVSVAEEHGFLTNEQRTADFASFCHFVESEYAYFDVKKTDWGRACRFYGHQATSATDRVAYVELLERALGELYDQHAHLGINTRKSPRLVPTQTDLVATWSGGRAIITDVRANSAAERAGLRPSIEVIEINGETVESVVNRIEPRFLSREDPAAREWALQAALAGRRDRDTVRLLTRMGESDREFEFAYTDPVLTSLLSHRAVGKVGYVRIHNSLGEQALVHEFDKALSEMPGVRALVIDLRDTPSGGNSSVARGIMGRLVQEMLPYQRHELVSEFRSTGIRRVWNEYVAPRGAPFLQPIVVLVGRWTGSMGEGLAIGLNATRGAPVLGEPMAHLLGALGETVLPYSKIVVRVPTEKLYHIDGTPREAFIPCGLAPSGASALDRGLDSAIDLAVMLGGMKSNPSLQPTCYGLRPPRAAELKR